MKRKRVDLDTAKEKLKSYGVSCSPRELAAVLGGNPYWYSLAAKDGTLKFNHWFIGKQLRISTESVIKIISGE